MVAISTDELLVDFHIHSRYSRACSQSLTPATIAQWARMKGLRVVGTGDFTHPEWLAELEHHLVEDGSGLLALAPADADDVAARTPPSCRGDIRFLLTTEISTIYKAGDKTRKVHHVIVVRDFASARRFNETLGRLGNLASDGRPILGVDSKRILEITLGVGGGAYLIPAHIWTPWFSLLGHRSGFDSLEECFGDLAPEVFAVETGLSSDPLMNRRLSALDRLTLVSNSDAHSPAKLARECTAFRCAPAFDALKTALRQRDGYAGTIEFFPEEGKYHFDGHRKCGQRMRPEATCAAGGLCPACGKEVTVGVMHRVQELADRTPEAAGAAAAPFQRLIPLQEIIAEALAVGVATRGVQDAYLDLLGRLGPELHVLRHAPLDALDDAAPANVAEAVRRMRRGEVYIEPGYDGEFGTVRLFSADERQQRYVQLSLF